MYWTIQSPFLCKFKHKKSREAVLYIMQFIKKSKDNLYLDQKYIVIKY